MGDKGFKPALSGDQARVHRVMRIVFVLFLLCDAQPVFAAAGDLDLSFNNGGIRIIEQFGDNRGQAVAIQKTDGKIVVAGQTNASGNNDIMVLRLNVNGSLDTTFNNGQPQVVSQSGEDFGQAVALQNDGKIVVAGTTNTFGT